DELLGPREPVELADGRNDRQRDGGVHARDRHQPFDLLTRQRDPPERSVDDPQLWAVEVELAQQRLDRERLIRWERLVREPAAALDPEQVSDWRPGHQVAMKDRLHLVLQPGSLPDDV